MAAARLIIEQEREARAPARRAAACLVLLLASASCVPIAASGGAPVAAAGLAMIAPPAAPAGTPPADPAAPPEPDPMLLKPVAPGDARAINAAIPISAAANPRAASVVFRAASAGDQQRSLDCLAQAVYYEARSESEDGQRAVAQVVLNRVRHPAYPDSVCGVVYQGPMRSGGGCQFTFTCDGSLASAAAGPAWDRARRIAAEALAGAVYGPVGYATSYHSQDVVPVWAYRLAKSAVIGAHIFYRLPGGWGAPGAFDQAYARREPVPALRPAPRLATLPEPRADGWSVQSYAAAIPAVAGGAAMDDRLPDSQVKAEYRSSGQWLDQPGDAPAR